MVFGVREKFAALVSGKEKIPRLVLGQGKINRKVLGNRENYFQGF